MALEIIHTERAYMVVDNEQGRWSSQSLYGSYLNARKFALAWRAVAKRWRACWKEAVASHYHKIARDTREP